MNIILIIPMILVILMLFCFYLSWRNKKVCYFCTKIIEEDYKYNINLINNDYENYENKRRNRDDQLPSSEYMLLHFWVWPLDKFLSKEDRK